MFTLNDDAGNDLIDVRDIIARVEHLEQLRQPGPVDLGDDNETAQDDLFAELATCEAILADLAGSGGDEDWRGDWYPVTLIRESYFEEYARELVEDCGYIAKDFPSWIKVDWSATALNVRMDYTPTEIEGVTYWYR